MLDEKIKKILLDEYCKADNYQQILKNIKKMKRKKNSYSTFIHYKLVPCGITLALCIVILQNKNIKNELAKRNTNKNEMIKEYEIAEKNTIQDENNVNEIEEKNNIISNELNENVENNNTKISDNKNTNSIQKDNTVKSNLIYKNINCGEASWKADPSISSNLIDKNTSIVKVKILSIGEAEILPKQDKFYDPYRAYTPIKMKVIENMNENKLPEEITAYLTGGKIKISSLEKSISSEQAENLGISTLSKNEKEKFIQYSTEYDYDIENGNEYIIIIKKVNDNLYRISENGYDIFDINTQRNVLTNNLLVY